MYYLDCPNVKIASGRTMTASPSPSLSSGSLSLSRTPSLSTPYLAVYNRHAPLPTSPTPTPGTPIIQQPTISSSTSLLSTMDTTYTYLPLGIKALIFSAMALGFMWAILVWLVNFPPGTLGLGPGREEVIQSRGKQKGPDRSRRMRKKKKKKKKKKGGSKNQGKGIWGWRWNWAWTWWKERASGEKGNGGGRATRMKMKPLDKPSKYACIASPAESYLPSTTETASVNTAVESNRKSLLQHSHQHSAGSYYLHYNQAPSLASTTANRHKGIVSTPPPALSTIPISQNQHQHQARQPLISPINPYLTTPSPLTPNQSTSFKQRSNHNRTSSEWLTERAAFFLMPRSPPPPLSPSSSDWAGTIGTTSSEDESEDIDPGALEEQRTPLIHRRARNHGLGSPNQNTARYSTQGSWLNSSLQFIDGAVDKAVGKMARWMEDSGGDEALLLPVRKGDKMD